MAAIHFKGNATKIRKHKPLIIIILAVAVVCYFWGAVSIHEQIFPTVQLRRLRNIVTGVTLHAPKPHETFFQTFSPQSDVVMIGDSITAGAYWNEIFPNVKIANRGTNGDTTYDILRRMDTILSVSPKKAFVMAGINDIYGGHSVDQIFRNYISIMKELQGKNIAVYIQSTLECEKSACGMILATIRELNKKLSSYATANNIKYININEGLTSDTCGLLSDYTPDGVHLDGKGYLAWSNSISKS